MKPAVIIAGGVLVLSALAQTGRDIQVRGPFQLLIHDKQSRRVALLTGQGVQGLGARAPLQSVRLDYFGERGVTNLSVVGTNCLYDANEQTATSPDPLRILTGDDRLAIAGRGFTWWQTNHHLVISNDVTTELRRPTADPNAAAVAPLFVRAGLLDLQYASNLVTYSRGVQIDEASLQLECAEFTVAGVLTGGVQRLVASGGVRILNRADGSRTECAQAIYRDSPEGETIELLGEPRWSDGARSGSADRMILNQSTHRLLALGNARLAVPRGGADAGGLLGLGFGSRPDPTATPTNALVEVRAGALDVELPSTNGPVRRIVATTNVVIRDLSRPGGATAQRADYRAPGALELTGEPAWNSGGTEVRAELLSFDVLRQTASALTNATVRLPLARLRERFAGEPSAEPSTNEVIEVRSDYAAYQGGTLRFGEQVTAVFLVGNAPLGKLTCRSLGVTYSNTVQALRAAGNVVVDQYPLRRADGAEVSRQIRGDRFAVTFSPQEQLESVLAEGDVTAHQEERTGATNVARRELLAQRVEARFGPTNRVESAAASGNVVLTAGPRSITGETAEFSDRDGLLRLRGNPVAVLPEGRITGADEFIWDSRTRRYRVKGAFLSRWTGVPGLTNLSRILPNR